MGVSFQLLSPIYVMTSISRSTNPTRLNMFFTIGSITANVSALPVGAMLERYGSRICGFAGCASLVAGCLLMAYTSSVAQFDGYIIGNFFLALGGTFIFVPSFQIANAFPKHAGTIVALVTGAFDASAAVYLFYRLLYEGSHRTLSLHKFFLIYLLVPAFILISNLTIMQPSDYQNQYHLEMKIEKPETQPETSMIPTMKSSPKRSAGASATNGPRDDAIGCASWTKS